MRQNQRHSNLTRRLANQESNPCNARLASLRMGDYTPLKSGGGIRWIPHYSQVAQ